MKEEELKGQIIDKIFETGGNGILGNFLTKWTEIRGKFGVNCLLSKHLEENISLDLVTIFLGPHDEKQTISILKF